MMALVFIITSIFSDRIKNQVQRKRDNFSTLNGNITKNVLSNLFLVVGYRMDTLRQNINLHKHNYDTVVLSSERRLSRIDLLLYTL